MRWALVMALLAGCSIRALTYQCESGSQCGAAGICVDGACAFASNACPSGFKFDPSANAGRGGQCTEPLDMAMDAAMHGDDLPQEGDMPSQDAAAADLSSSPDLILVPQDAGVGGPIRLLSPLSGSNATQLRPTLRWTLTDGDVLPQVTICHDRACTSPVAVPIDYGGLTTARPHSDLPPGNYFWNVTMTDLSGTLSSAVWEFSIGHRSATTVDTGVGLLHDYNGDGIDDLVIGQRYLTVSAQQRAGRVHTYLGQIGALAAGSLAEIKTLDGTVLQGAFGTAVSSGGDINGDGFADLIVGADNDPSPAPMGQVFVYLGNSSLDATHGFTAGPTLSESTNGAFGAAVTSIDLDGDGFNDIVVGAPKTTVSASTNAGMIHVYYGASNGVRGSGTQHFDDGSTAYDAFGGAIACGDFNGDGYGDIAATAVQTPRVTFFLGGPTGVAKDLSHFPSIIVMNQPGYGDSIAAGDINGDGFADLIVGADGADPTGAGTGNGRVFVYFGGANGMTAQPVLEAVDGAGGGFGVKLALGDVNGDGFADGLIGAWAAPVAGGGGPGPGRSYVFKGGRNGFVVPNAAYYEGENAGDTFGRPVAVLGDIDADGLDDFAAAAIQFNNASGKFYVCKGSSGLLPTTFAKTIAGSDQSSEMGWSIY